MDPLGKINTAAGIGNICSSDSFNILPPPQHHDLMSANSIELNAAASLSDDSGVPNSSISSGDSYKLGMCKFENEMAESDGEVSQFDSLDNFSEGGMSAENFNTLKKGPLGCPIDPPPEFQDSPQTTLVRSISKSIVGNLRRWTSSQSSFEHLRVQESASKENHDCGGEPLYPAEPGALSLKESYAINKHLYSSDSILNTHTDNIYDEPNNMISSSLGNSVDMLESESSSSSPPLPPPPPPVSIVKIKQTLCPYFQDHTRYFKAIPSEQDNITQAAVAVATAAHKFNQSGLSEIHDYDLYYGAKRGGAGYDSLQRKVLYSPLNHSHHCHSYHYHTGSTSCGNRPNSRNSLNSRLSSSHNSLSVSSANKPDDSIFITQAMSHDALLTREISDFYNVPIDSDIYAFPVDMIQSDNECHSKSKASGVKAAAKSSSSTQAKGYRSTKSRNKRKRRQDYASGEDGESGDQRHANTSRSKYRLPVSANEANNDSLPSDDQQLTQEPLHMTLDEVKQFYHSLYAGRGGGKGQNGQKSSNETIWSVASSRTNLGGATSTTGTTATSTGATTNTTTTTTTKEKNATNLRKMTKSSTKLNAADNESSINNNNNNNNINTISNHNKQHNLQHQHQPPQQQPPSSHTQSPSLANAEANGQQASGQQGDKQSAACNHATLSGNKQHASLHGSGGGDKKSQFTVSLKQKFCSFFRFRRHNRCRSNSADTDEAMGGRSERCGSVQSVVDDKRKKFQSRALPPLPKKNLEQPEEVPATEEEEDAGSKKAEHRPFHFTSSIEKVKDYGWYWGPLSSEAAEKVLSNEPDGSFIVRDSSDDHYIFSLSFKLNNCVRHVRIEQDQGTFSFGSYAKFKSQTITEFIEKAVEHSRSGRYLFFLHRRPEHGPMRVQLTNPVSRFKHVQSLQHMCRFVILKAVIRKDLIQTLPLPRRLLDYLNYKHCYSEQIEIQSSSNSQMSGDGSI